MRFTRMIQGNTKFRAAFAIAISVAFSLLPSMISAQSVRPSKSLSQGFRFFEMSGEELFANVCQGCHMPDARGATGAGTYPSLVADANLEVSGYPLDIVVNGHHAMPPFGAMMSDDQVAAVVNYLRTHFGNHYRDAVTSGDVRSVRR
jgi:mono/diheme cytochrome c family protein